MALEHSPASPSATPPGFPLGAARSSFVASLRQRSAALETALDRLQDRGELRELSRYTDLREQTLTELEALHLGAKRLRVRALQEATSQALSLLRRAPKYQVLSQDEHSRLRSLVRSLPTLAYRAGEPAAVLSPTRSALLVGVAEAERALSSAHDDGHSYECSHAVSVEEAATLAATLLPDLVLVDGDHVDVLAVLAALEEHVTEQLPVVVLASDVAERRAEWLAAGVRRVLERPLAALELRKRIDQLFDGEQLRPLRGAIGTPSLGALRELLLGEWTRALSADEGSDELPVPMGEGSEVLGAVWGAASRVREVIAARTGGQVHFAHEGPYGAIACAPSLDLAQLAGRRTGLRRREVGAFSLQGFRVLIADDDPAVVWFLADALRQEGATVHEAHDGEAALALAGEVLPDLLITDILMPKLDGLSLSRRLQQHPLLAGLPILLLSWKEDLLAKAREFGAGAAGYLCKESERGAVVFHAREALATQVRLRARLRSGLDSGAEVHGRFDKLTPFALLSLVASLETPARVLVREGGAHYELTLEGHKLLAYRSSGDSLERGEAALRALLGTRAVRFTVQSGGLAEDERAHCIDLREASLRYGSDVAAVQRALHEHTDAEATFLRFDTDALDRYAASVPAFVAAALHSLAEGASLAQAMTPALRDWLPEALHDLAARGVLHEVVEQDAATQRLELGSARALLAPPLAETAAPPAIDTHESVAPASTHWGSAAAALSDTLHTEQDEHLSTPALAVQTADLPARAASEPVPSADEEHAVTPPLDATANARVAKVSEVPECAPSQLDTVRIDLDAAGVTALIAAEAAQEAQAARLDADQATSDRTGASQPEADAAEAAQAPARLTLTHALEPSAGEETAPPAPTADAQLSPAAAAAVLAEVRVETRIDPTLYGGPMRFHAELAAPQITAAPADDEVAGPAAAWPDELAEADAQAAADDAPALEASQPVRASDAEDDAGSAARFDAEPAVPAPSAQAHKPKRRSLIPVGLLATASGGALAWALWFAPNAADTAQAHQAAPQSVANESGIVEVEAQGSTVLVDGVPRGRGQRVSVVLPRGRHTISTDGKHKPRQIEVRPSEVVRLTLEP